METILEDTSSSALSAAIESNIFSLFKLFDQWPKAALSDTPELLWSMTNIPYPLFNSVMRARLPADKVDAAIDSTLAEYSSRHLPMMWWVGPSTQPEDLGSRLSERGFQVSVNPGMAADLSSLPESYPVPEALRIKHVENEEELAIFSRVMIDVFGMPAFVTAEMFDLFSHLGFDGPLLNYIGLVDGEVVATSSVLHSGGVAGIYNVTTLESARRKGIGAAMTAVPLLEARALGYRVGTLESSESGFNVYRQLGFQEYCKLYRYVWMGDG